MDVSVAGGVESETLDPRILRSRRMLREALAALLETKEFDKISIQEIAETSTLNRATFYDHYPDKVALLQCLVGSRFEALIAKRNVGVDPCAGALRALALGVCDFLAATPANRSAAHEGSLQAAVIGIVRRMVREGLRDGARGAGISPDVLASTAAWAIYGAATAWVADPQRGSAEDMAEVIERLVSPVFAAAESIAATR